MSPECSGPLPSAQSPSVTSQSYFRAATTPRPASQVNLSAILPETFCPALILAMLAPGSVRRQPGRVPLWPIRCGTPDAGLAPLFAVVPSISLQTILLPHTNPVATLSIARPVLCVQLYCPVPAPGPRCRPRNHAHASPQGPDCPSPVPGAAIWVSCPRGSGTTDNCSTGSA